MEEKSEGEDGKRSGSGEESATLPSMRLFNSKFEGVAEYKDACYGVCSSGEIELYSEGVRADRGDSAYPVITTDEVLKLAEIVGEKQGESAKKIKPEKEELKEAITEYIELIPKLKEAGLYLNYGLINGKLAITAYGGVDNIAKLFGSPTKLRKSGIPDLPVHRYVELENAIFYDLLTYEGAKCKQVGTEKKIVMKHEVVEEAEYREVEEEIEVPIFECGEGKVVT